MSTQPHMPMARHVVERTGAKHMPLSRSAVRQAIGALLGGLVLLSLGAPHPVQAQAAITVSHVVPADIPGGAQAATLEDAAAAALLHLDHGARASGPGGATHFHGVRAEAADQDG